MVEGGWDKCKKIEEEISCQKGKDRCAKAKVDTFAGNMTYTFYVKSCASEKECQDKNCGRINPGIPNLRIKKSAIRLVARLTGVMMELESQWSAALRCLHALL